MMKHIKSQLLIIFVLVALVFNATDFGVQAQEIQEPIPTKYDGRDYDYLTPVRDQKKSNMCWAYATLASIEADAVKNHSFNRNLDLSEYHLAYFTFSNKKDKLGLISADSVSFHNPSSSNNFITNGANLSYAVSTLTSGVGPVLESDVPTSQIFNATGEVLSDAYTWKIDEKFCRNKNAFEIDNVYIYTLKNGIEDDLIKRGIMEHGAAAAMYYSQNPNAYYTTTEYGTAHYQNDASKDPDHGIAIVGWDDNYPISAFREGARPTHPGAWLVKNSWGNADYFTTDGYLWVSYEDASFTHNTSEGKAPEAYIYDTRPAGKYKYTYQYDGGIIHEFSSTPIEQNATKYANIFKAQSDGKLEAISIHTDRGFANAPCKLQVYTGVGTIPDQGSLAYEKDFTVPGNGYFTIPLSKPVEIKKDQTFSIVIKQSSDWQVTYICTDRTYDPGGSAFVSTNYTEPNQSFIFSGVEQQWKDLKYEKFYSYEDGTSLCIKAFVNESIQGNPGGNIEPNPTSSVDKNQEEAEKDRESTEEKNIDKLSKVSFTSLKANHNSIVIKWKKSKSKITAYEIQYSTSKNFKKGNKKVTVKANSKASKTIKHLKQNKKYYIRIRSYRIQNGKKQYAKWSITKSIKTKRSK